MEAFRQFLWYTFHYLLYLSYSCEVKNYVHRKLFEIIWESKNNELHVSHNFSYLAPKIYLCLNDEKILILINSINF